MKHLIKYNELKSSTYLSASKKLKDLRHINRSKNLEDWGGKIEAEEKRVAEEEQRVKWANSGVYHITVFTSKWENGGHKDEDILTGKFHISLDYERDMFSDQYWDWAEGNYNHNLFIAFTMGILPADKETSLKFKENVDIQSNLWRSGLWPQWLFIRVANEGETILNVSGDSVSIDSIDYLKFRFNDRQNSLKFKKFLISELSGQSNNTDIRNKVDKHISLIKTDETYRSNIPDDFLDRLAKSASRMSLNKLYRES